MTPCSLVDKAEKGKLKKKHDRQRTHNVTLRPVRATTVAAEKQLVLHTHISRICVCSLRYLAWNAQAPYCHLSPLRLYYIFPHYYIKGTIFENKLLNIKCVFRFSLQLLCKTFLILWRTERDKIKKMYTGLHVKYPLFLSYFNSLRTKRMCYIIRTQSVPRSKHSPLRL